MRKYPIGQQHFKALIERGFVYVDKTKLIHTLVESGDYYFLSRPRRFGKSLLLSTIEELFSGNKSLFKGLWIENNWNWKQKHPVIPIGISSIDYQELGLKRALSQEMDKIAQGFGWPLNAETLKDKFKELIEKAALQESVVILIDEYDKPIIDYLTDPNRAELNREVFKEFYSVLKDASKYIRLLMITGVSRFSKVSIFSDLNNLKDITLSPAYATLTGITQEELESNFAEEITELQKTNRGILKDLKTWYNGYSWNEGADTVYNPFSLLNFKALDTLISTIPYDHWKAESESIFHIIAHLSFRNLGLDIRSEPHSAKGRCAIVIETEKYMYALELKLNSTPAKALQQIVKKEYLRPYQMDKREKIAIGINFSSKERKVDGYKVFTSSKL